MLFSNGQLVERYIPRRLIVIDQPGQRRTPLLDHIQCGDFLLPEAKFRKTLNTLFPPPDSSQTDWQKICLRACRPQRISIVTGGQGTEKTTTEVRLLALLQAIVLTQDSGRPLQIRQAAPTGKAAARLKESIFSAIEKLPAFVRDKTALTVSIATEVTTPQRSGGLFI